MRAQQQAGNNLTYMYSLSESQSATTTHQPTASVLAIDEEGTPTHSQHHQASARTVFSKQQIGIYSFCAEGESSQVPQSAKVQKKQQTHKAKTTSQQDNC
jgi:hypothetical protein